MTIDAALRRTALILVIVVVGGFGLSSCVSACQRVAAEGAARVKHCEDNGGIWLYQVHGSGKHRRTKNIGCFKKDALIMRDGWNDE